MKWLDDIKSSRKCQICSRASFFTNKVGELNNNFKQFEPNRAHLRMDEVVCESCYEKERLLSCQITSKPFKARENKAQAHNGSNIQKNFSPVHRFGSNFSAVSPQGLAEINLEHQKLQSRLHSWVEGTKFDEIKGYCIIREFELVRTPRLASLSSVEHDLKWRSAQAGGNAYIRYWWERHDEYVAEEFIAGYGPKGNPYFRTRNRKLTFFSARAIPAFVVDKRHAGRRRDQGEDRSDARLGSEEALEILNIKAPVAFDDLRHAYLQRIREYHPDKVAALGPKLRALAEAESKRINAAYELLRREL